MINKKIRDVLEKQQYRIVGNHSAVKICHWTKESLTRNRVCYKEKWYGIKSHRCMEFTPSTIWCDHHCLWCWRLQVGDRKELKWKEYPFNSKIDDPAEILDKAIEARKKLLTGFGGNNKVDKKKFKEALEPTSIAISLSGEPTLYPRISELIEECHKRNIFTFLVTNGTTPEVLEKMTKPSQLYITLPAPNEKVYLKSCRPIIKNGWKKIMKSLELLKTFDCRTVIRLTLVKNLNMINPEQYAELIERANPMFVEAKGYVHVGESQKRLKQENMPTHEEIKDFAKEISKYCSYKIKDDFRPSRVVLLTQ